MEDFTAAEYDLARNFGFDITMPEGNMGLPGAVHKEYLDKCHALYREFLSNMSALIKAEKSDKAFLNNLLGEKMRNMKYSLYRFQNTRNERDPFARRIEMPCESLVLSESRNNTPFGHDVIRDQDEGKTRPHTAPPGVVGKKVHGSDGRPNTAAVDKPSPDDDDSLSNISVNSSKTITGLIDPKTERTSDRKITVGHHSFAKLARGDVRVKMKNRDGRFLMKPAKTVVKQEQTAMTAYDPMKSSRTYDPVNEKIALVRQITSYRSPTISSDMKINNRVPIQKTLRGLDAKRTTVLGIYQSARDRQSRYFRIVTNKHKEADVQTLQQNSQTENTDGPGVPVSIQLNGLDAQAEMLSRQNSRMEMTRDNSRASSKLSNVIVIPTGRENTDAHLHTPTSVTDDLDLAASASHFQFKPDLQSLLENEIEPQELHRVSQTKVAFVKSDSHTSSCHRSVSQTDTIDLGASGSAASPSILSRKVNTLSLASDRSPVVAEGSDSASVVKPLPPQPRRPSLAATVAAVSFVQKLKNSVKASDNASQTNSQLSFRAPPKFASSRDTVKIVKQQMRRDKELDERMTVWRRRMSIRSSASSIKAVLRSSRSKPRLI